MGQTMTNTYCYYHRHARMEIIQRGGQTYAACPECRQILYSIHTPKMSQATLESTISDELLERLENPIKRKRL